MEHSEFRLSIALATRNRPESLRRTLESLSNQEDQPYEVVVSDDSDRRHFDEIRKICLEFGHSYYPGPKLGLYANRNAAALACSGTHIRTMDDDHEFPAGHITACLQAIEAEPRSIWIIGECWPDDAKSADQVIHPPQLNARGFSNLPPETSAVWGIADGASILPRTIFDLGHRYFDYFCFGSSYLEFGSRLHWLGFSIRHLDTTFVIHHFDPESRSVNDSLTDTASRLFAALCHSFLYQRTLKNRSVTLAEVLWTTAKSPVEGVQAVSLALKAFRKHKPAMRQGRLLN